MNYELVKKQVKAAFLSGDFSLVDELLASMRRYELRNNIEDTLFRSVYEALVEEARQ